MGPSLFGKRDTLGLIPMCGELASSEASSPHTNAPRHVVLSRKVVHIGAEGVVVHHCVELKVDESESQLRPSEKPFELSFMDGLQCGFVH